MGFSIKGNNVSVKIEVVCRPYSNAENIWDLNWLTCDISIKIPGYTANFNTYLTCSEIQSFFIELKQMLCFATKKYIIMLPICA